MALARSTSNISKELGLLEDVDVTAVEAVVVLAEAVGETWAAGGIWGGGVRLEAGGILTAEAMLFSILKECSIIIV